MAKKQAKSPIVGNLEEYNIVEKSRPLMLMKEVPFALGELKVLDTYLSRINARDPEATTVRFSKEEYEGLMGIERMHPERLNKYVTSLQGKTVKVPDSSVKSGWRNYNLFDESAFEQDDNGQWWIDLCCTPKAKKLFFNIDGIGYIRYQLKNVLPLTSKYSVLLYIYLMDNRFRASWDIPLDDLREKVLHCTEPLYLEFKYLNQRILKKCINEINDKTDLQFKYEPVRKGRSVFGIKFTLIRDEASLPEAQIEGQRSLFDEDDDLTAEERAALAELDAPEEPEKSPQENLLEMLQERIPECSNEEIEDLISIAYKHVPADRNNVLPREHRIVDYIMSQVLYTKARKPKHFFTYLRGAVQKNYSKWINQ